MKANNHKPLAQDIAQSRRFLELLDEEAEVFTFQTFDDNADRKDPSLIHVINGTLDEHWESLKQLNDQGAGIYVTVQETDGSGRKLENITRIRAVFRELDRKDPPKCPLEPHIIVESSPGHTHEYFLTDAPMEAADTFSGVMERLCSDYGSDPNAKVI